MTLHRSQNLLLAGVLVLTILLVPAVALAAGGPTLTPRQVMTEGFEGALPARLTLDWPNLGASYPYSAYWGPVTQRAHSGARGLWCAGSIPESDTPHAWAVFGGVYPNYTAGLAEFDLPELASMYSATVDYWYTMPSIGSADGEGLNVLWKASGDELWDHHNAWPISSGWTHVTMDMSLPSDAVSLSRSAGTLRFQFFDDAGDFGEAPTNGEGPTIDDVTVTGYTYGPVRSLSATLTADSVHLSWQVPARSTALPAIDEERPVAYRVFRELDGSNAWTELTTGRTTTGLSFDDTDVSALDGAYRYVVQAWDADGGPGYGRVVLPADSATATFERDPAAPIFVITGVPTGATNTTVTPGILTTTTAPSIDATLDGEKFMWGDGIGTEGTHTLFVRVTNADGAASLEQAVFLIDRTPPTTTVSAPSGIQFAPVTVTLSAVDALSGVAGTHCVLDSIIIPSYTGPLHVTTWGDHILYYSSSDRAGNGETVHVLHFSMRQRTTLSINSTPSSARRHHSLTVYGYLSPGKKGEKISLKYQKPGSSKWYSSTRYTIVSGPRGKWSYKFTPTKKGTYHFKVSYAGSSVKYKSASTTRAVRVR